MLPCQVNAGTIVAILTYRITCAHCQNVITVHRCDILLVVCPHCKHASSIGTRMGRRNGLIYLFSMVFCLFLAFLFTFTCDKKCESRAALIFYATVFYILTAVLAHHAFKHLRMRESKIEALHGAL